MNQSVLSNLRLGLGLVLVIVVSTANTKAETLEETDPTLEDPCQLSPVPGTCHGEFIEYFYDPQSRRCRQFIYSGCGGNGNRFESEEQCISMCSSPTATNNGFQKAAAKDPSDYLVLNSSDDLTVFTFAEASSFIQLTEKELGGFLQKKKQEINFEFRTTTEADGLLFYHNLRGKTEFELYVSVQRGNVNLARLVDSDETVQLIETRLKNGDWHTVNISFDAASGHLQVSLDEETRTFHGLEVTENDSRSQEYEFNSAVMFFGGINQTGEESRSSEFHHRQFAGCLRNIQLRSGLEEAVEAVRPLVAGKYASVQTGCIDKCADNKNGCRNGGKCRNHYNRIACDCFGTSHEGETCESDSLTVLSMHGDSYVSYVLPDSMETTRISVQFRALHGDSVLFYAEGADPVLNYVAISLLSNSSIYLEFGIGSGSQSAVLEGNFTDGLWNRLTVTFLDSSVNLTTDKNHNLNIPFRGNVTSLQISSPVYIGGDRRPKGKGLKSSNNFVGCLEEVYVNDVSVLYQLRVNAPQATYHGGFPPQFGVCSEIPQLPVTFVHGESQLPLTIPEPLPFSRYRFDLVFSLRTRSPTASLVGGYTVREQDTIPTWELKLQDGRVEFAINDTTESKRPITLNDGTWHQVQVKYDHEETHLSVDGVSTTFSLKPEFKEAFGSVTEVVFGRNSFNSNSGFVGCVKDVTINRKKLDPRNYLNRNLRLGGVLLDRCSFLQEPYGKPNICKHGGLLSFVDGKIVCNCAGTGYTGKYCQFAIRKKSCEELAVIGYTGNGVYEIDIDGNGPFPQAHVSCETDPGTGRLKTVVEHNLAPGTGIRSRNFSSDIVFSLEYRDFTSEMLQWLISHSAECRQYIRYDCRKAPLELRSYTWFQSSSGDYVDFLAESKPGTCPCWQNRTCSSSDSFCNCDSDENKWRLDDGFFTQPKNLGITKIFALQQKSLEASGEGLLTLGALECYQTSTLTSVITFQKSESYIRVPGWHRGSFSFGFRTFNPKAVLVYQRQVADRYPHLRIILENEFDMSLIFSSNGKSRRIVLKSSSPLNSGEWQHVWIDSDEYQVRFTVNRHSLLVDLDEDEQFGPFETDLFIGGAPRELVNGTLDSQGLIGCFRGLVMNDQVIDLPSLVERKMSGISVGGCQSSCDSNPCRNGATCVELWGSYRCQCANGHAHSGRNCEININEKSVAFRKREAVVEVNAATATDDGTFEPNRIFKEDIWLNLRTLEQNALILYAYDNLNNFVQVHLENSSVVFTFNSARKIQRLSVPIPEGKPGQPLQVYVDREAQFTTLEVNGVSVSTQTHIELLKRYYRHPWMNGNKELVKPPRSLRRPEEFHQIFVGGIDREYINTTIPGFLGCLSGFKVGNTLVNLNAENLDENSGISNDCVFFCDEEPCRNGGICAENFAENSFNCDCQFTSYKGPTCDSETIVGFHGNSFLTVPVPGPGEFNTIQVEFAFSTVSLQNGPQILVFITSNQNKYLVIGIDGSGYLFTEEKQKEDQIHGAKILITESWIGARHFVYYKRDRSAALFLVDGERIFLENFVHSSFDLANESTLLNDTAIYIGGLMEAENFNNFTGCLSNVEVEIDGLNRLSEPFVSSNEPTGEPQLRCGVLRPKQSMPSKVNEDIEINREISNSWNPGLPKITKYQPVFVLPPKYDSTLMKRVLLGLGCLFLFAVLLLGCYLFKTHRRSRKREYSIDENQCPPRQTRVKGPHPGTQNRTVRNVGVTVGPKTANDNGKLNPNNGEAGPVTPTGKAVVEDLIRFIDSAPVLEGRTVDDLPVSGSPVGSDTNIREFLANGSSGSAETCSVQGSGSNSSLMERLIEEGDEHPVDEPLFLYSTNRAPLCRISEVFLSEDEDDVRRLPFASRHFITYARDHTF